MKVKNSNILSSIMNDMCKDRSDNIWMSSAREGTRNSSFIEVWTSSAGSTSDFRRNGIGAVFRSWMWSMFPGVLKQIPGKDWIADCSGRRICSRVVLKKSSRSLHSNLTEISGKVRNNSRNWCIQPFNTTESLKLRCLPLKSGEVNSSLILDYSCGISRPWEPSKYATLR